MVKLLIKVFILVLLVSFVNSETFKSSSSCVSKDCSIESSSGLNLPSSSSLNSVSSSSSTFSSSDFYSFESLPDEEPIDNGCSFFSKLFLNNNFDIEILDSMKETAQISNCTNLDNTISALTIFSNNIRDFCPTNETQISKSMYSQLENLFIRGVVRELYYDSINQPSCDIIQDAYSLFLNYYFINKDGFVIGVDIGSY